MRQAVNRGSHEIGNFDLADIKAPKNAGVAS